MPSINAQLARLSTLKELAEVVGRDYKTKSAEFKEHQTVCLDLMAAQECKSWRGNDGTLYTRCEDRLKGQVEDRRKYIRWALEQDEGISEFLSWLDTQLGCHYEPGHSARAELEDRFFESILSTELVTYKEKQDRANAQARAHVDDEQPLPPGLTFRPDPYIQQRRS